MQDRLKVAVVGAGIRHSPDGREGWAVRAHLPALKALPGLFEPIAVCTTRLESAREAARHFDIPHAFDSVAAMLAQLPQIDVVCVSVRPPLHFEVVIAALEAGKHVYCEQPLGLSTAQAREMYALAKRKRLRTIVGHQSHHEPAALHMAALVRDGYIGRPLAFGHSYFVSNYITPRPPHRQWLFQAAMGGHPGYRSGHSLDRVHSVLGQDVTAICADMAVQVPSAPNSTVVSRKLQISGIRGGRSPRSGRMTSTSTNVEIELNAESIVLMAAAIMPDIINPNTAGGSSVRMKCGNSASALIPSGRLCVL